MNNDKGYGKIVQDMEDIAKSNTRIENSVKDLTTKVNGIQLDHESRIVRLETIRLQDKKR